MMNVLVDEGVFVILVEFKEADGSYKIKKRQTPKDLPPVNPCVKLEGKIVVHIIEITIYGR